MKEQSAHEDMNVKATCPGHFVKKQLNQDKQNEVKIYDFRSSGHGLNTDFVFKLFSSGLHFETNNMELMSMHYCDYLTLNWVHHSAYFTSQNALKLTYARL